MSDRPKGKRPKNCFESAKSPYWQYDLVIRGERERGSTGKKSARDAEAFVAQKRAEMMAQQAAGRDSQGRKVREKISLAAACDYYEKKIAVIDADGNTKIDPTTKYQLANLVAILCDEGDDRSMSDIETGDFELYRLRRPSLVPPGRENRRPVKGSTINREIELARRVWGYAARLGYDVGEPIDWRAVIDKSAEVERIRELSVEEEARLIPCLEQINRDLLVVVEFALLSGQRKAALIKLRWSDVDLVACEASVVLKTKGQEKRRHRIPLTARMVEILKSCPKVGPFVFTYECRRDAPERSDRVARVKGHRYPFSVAGWTRQWRQALDDADIVDFRWHDLRHTAATRLLRRVNNLKAAQTLLGHTSIDQTARYAHVFSDDLRSMMEQSEQLHRARIERATAPDQDDVAA